MSSRLVRPALIAGVALFVGACASSEQWTEWRQHTTHFASGDHAFFSLRNNLEGTNPKVYRTDIEAARKENWWGKAITVSPEQIFQN